MKSFTQRFLVICVLFFVFCLLIVPKIGFSNDLDFWFAWSDYMRVHGLGKVYQTNSNYLPLYHYVLWMFGLLKGNTENLHAAVYQLKWVTLLFHFGTCYFLALFVNLKKHDWKETLYFVMFYFLNAAVLYNTLLWGQVDEILSFFVFGSVFFAYRKRLLLTMVFILLAINFKLQSIVFVPVVFLLIIPEMINQFSFKKMGLHLAVLLLLQFLIVLPFILAGTLPRMWEIVFTSVDMYPSISMNAFNLWDLIFKGYMIYKPDSTVVMGLSYKHWGLLMFFTLSGTALLPLMKSVYLSIRDKKTFDFSMEKIMLTGAIIALLFFYVNTQMHERYAHPAIIFLVAFAIMKKKPGIAILGSLAYLINLEDVMKYFNFPNYSIVLLHRDFVASLYLITLVWAYVELFVMDRRKQLTSA